MADAPRDPPVEELPEVKGVVLGFAVDVERSSWPVRGAGVLNVAVGDRMTPPVRGDLSIPEAEALIATLQDGVAKLKAWAAENGLEVSDG